MEMKAMKFSKNARVLAILSAAVAIGCAGNIHESYDEERHVEPRERVVFERPRYEPRERVDESDVRTRVDARDERPAPETIVRQDVPPRYDPRDRSDADVRVDSRPDDNRAYSQDAPPRSYDNGNGNDPSRDYRDDRPVDVNVVAEQ